MTSCSEQKPDEKQINLMHKINTLGLDFSYELCTVGTYDPPVSKTRCIHTVLYCIGYSNSAKILSVGGFLLRAREIPMRSTINHFTRT